MTNYIRQRNKRIQKFKFKNNIIFGTVNGAILIILGLYKWMTTLFIMEKIWLAVFFLGILEEIVTLIYPSKIDYIKKLFYFVGNVIGKIFFILILSFIYILVILVGILFRKKKNKYFYMEWDDSKPKISSSFIDYYVRKSDSRGTVNVILSLIGYMSRNGSAILIPVVVLLLIFGIVLFFVSYSAITPFIYTLF